MLGLCHHTFNTDQDHSMGRGAAGGVRVAFSPFTASPSGGEVGAWERQGAIYHRPFTNGRGGGQC